MRRGYLIVEALLMVFMLATALAVFAPLSNVLMSDIPRSFRFSQVNTTLLNILEHMRKDIDGSGQVLGSFGDYVANENVLLLDKSDGVIGYELKDDEVHRLILDGDKHGQGPNTLVWSVPKAKVKWRLQKRNDAVYAVEVKTYIDYQVGRRSQEKMANSHLYFLNSRPEEVK
ncbi:MAG: hypothetical protein ACYSWP_12505 [Planctomycetota bacterium]